MQLKQMAHTFTSKIKSIFIFIQNLIDLEENLKQTKVLNEEQKKQID